MVSSKKGGGTPTYTKGRVAICPRCGKEERGNIEPTRLFLCSQCLISRSKISTSEPKSKRRTSRRERGNKELPTELSSHPQIGPYIKRYLNGENSPLVRKTLRGYGFRISDPNTWAKFIKNS